MNKRTEGWTDEQANVEQMNLCLCSGPGQVMEMELKVDPNSMAKLLKFLTGGFNGGTDVDKPLELSLKRLAEKEWNQVSCCIMCHWYGGCHQDVV